MKKLLRRACKRDGFASANKPGSLREVAIRMGSSILSTSGIDSLYFHSLLPIRPFGENVQVIKYNKNNTLIALIKKYAIQDSRRKTGGSINLSSFLPQSYPHVQWMNIP
ncbi:hypothetical protein LWC05_08760 [Acetobacter sicerae]|uniref:Uncharacterized protein n=1 Tax=Acetobacter sicerae TaxID=85325 RepID=A0ABS8VTH4_9PROT|nr:hypothetical protein [Acetobacter sicerae]MCE0743970.1 hypothetical protein [Acetobacter sicerae]